MKEENKIVENTNVENGLLFNAEITYTKEICKKAYKLLCKKQLILICIALVMSILILFGVALSDMEDKAIFIVVSYILVIIFIGYILRINKAADNYVKNVFNSRPNLKTKYYFYKDHFIVNSVSDNSSSSYSVKYDNVKLLKQDSKYIYINFNGLYSVIDIDTCDNKEGLFKLFSLSKVERGESKRVKTILLISFIISIASILFALMVVALSVQSSPLPDFPLIMVEHMWKFLLVIPIPLVSIILGIVFMKKGYKCKKNIIVGIIMVALLSLYGSFTNIFASQVSHDVKYLTKISDVTNIDIPSNAYISIAYDYLTEGDSLAMVKFDDNSMYTDNIENNLNWKTDISFIPSNVNNLFILSITSNYEYFTVYNITSNSYNNFDGELIYFAYNVDTSVLFIYCF